MKVLSSVCSGVKLWSLVTRGEQFWSQGQDLFLREEARGGRRKLTNELYDLCLQLNMNGS
jgi:hypothetical protein